jgi:ribosome maturation factor RimP
MLFWMHSFRAGVTAPAVVPRVGARPLFLREERVMTASQSDIEGRLAQTEPDVEVLLVEVLPSQCLRVFIDHPDGVTLALCERVSMRLNDLRELYALEVSSPGSQRPLTKPDHFRRFLGRRARVRTFRPRPIAAPQSNSGAGAHRSSAPAGPSAGRASRSRPLAAPGSRKGRRGQPHGSNPSGPESPAAAARTSFSGELVAASEQEVTLAAADGVISIPYSEIRRSNLLEE